MGELLNSIRTGLQRRTKDLNEEFAFLQYMEYPELLYENEKALGYMCLVGKVG